MKEARWRKHAEPEPMLQFVRDRIGDRKLRLFAVACGRRVWHLLPPGPGRTAVDVTERYADGLATRAQLTAARRGAGHYGVVVGRNVAREAVLTAAKTASWEARVLAADAAWESAGRPRNLGVRDRAWQAESQAQCDLLRDVIEPFRTPTLAPAVLRWNEGAVGKLAQAIYDERAFERLPILADALEDAGCDDADILGHCRATGTHMRGCWVVDLLLGKT